MLGTGQKGYGQRVAERVSLDARLPTVIRHRNQMPIPLIVEEIERSGASYCCVGKNSYRIFFVVVTQALTKFVPSSPSLPHRSWIQKRTGGYV
jgi:hypothetical protein